MCSPVLLEPVGLCACSPVRNNSFTSHIVRVFFFERSNPRVIEGDDLWSDLQGFRPNEIEVSHLTSKTGARMQRGKRPYSYEDP